MSNIGTLTIEMAANIARLQSDMNQAKSVVSESMKAVTDAVDLAKKAMVAFTGIASVEAFAGMVQGSLHGVAALHDLSIKTGATVEAMSALVAVGKVTGTTGDEIASMMNKLAKGMAVSNEESKGVGAAIAALGINFNDFNAMSPDEKMVTLAKSMNNFADGSGKSAVAMTLLGKSGADALPYLKELAEVGALQAKVTEEQAAQAHQFEVDQRKLTASGEAWKKELSLGMLPALQETMTATLGMVNGSGGLRDEVKRLSADGSIAEWTRNAVTGASYVLDAFSGLKAVIISIGESAGFMAASIGLQFAGIGEIVAKVINGDFSGAAEAYKSTTRQQQAMTEEFHATLDKTWGDQTLGQQLRARMADVRAMGVAHTEEKEKLDFNSKAFEENAKARDAAAKAGLDFAAKIREEDAALQLEFATGEKLTAQQKMLIKLCEDLASGKMKMTNAVYTETLAHIENSAAIQEDIKQNLAAKKVLEDQANAQAKATESIQQASTTLSEHINTIGLTSAEIQHLSAVRDLDNARILESKALWAEENGLGEQVSQGFRDQAQALRDLAGLKEQGIHVQAARDAQVAWEATTKQIGQGMSSAILDSVNAGKGAWAGFRDYIVRTILDGAIKNAFGSVITEGLNSMLSAITGMKLGGASSAGSVVSGISGASQLSSAGSVAGSVLTGGMSVANGAGTVAANAGYAGGGIDGLLATNGAFGTAATGGGTVATTVGTESAAAAGGVSGIGLGVVGIVALGALNSIFGASDVMTPDVWATLSPNPREVNDRLGVAGMAHPIFNTNAEFSAWSTAHGYASGGDHGGGLRIVGENGPELEATGPSRIFNAGQTQQILGGGGSDEVVAELRATRSENALMRADLARIKDILTRVTPKGAAVSVETVVIA